MALLDLLLMGGGGVSVTYPATVTNGTPFTWRIVNGKPNEGWWGTTSGAFVTTFGSQAAPFAYLDSSGNATYTNGDFSPNFGTITLTINFQSGSVITKTVTISKGATPTVTMPTEQDVGTPFDWTISNGKPDMSYIVRSTNTYAGTEGNWGTQLIPSTGISNIQILDAYGNATNRIYRTPSTVINPFGYGWDYGTPNVGRTITLTFTFSNGTSVTKNIYVSEPRVAFTSNIFSVAAATYSKDYYWIIAGCGSGKLLVSTDRGTKFYQKIFAYRVNGVLTQRTDVNILNIRYFPKWGTNATGIWVAATSIGCFYGYTTLWSNSNGTGFNADTFSWMEWIPLTDLNNILTNYCADAIYWDQAGAIYAINGGICARYGFFGAEIGVSRAAAFSKSTITYYNSTTSTETVTNNYIPAGNFTTIYAPPNPSSVARSALLIGASDGEVYHLVADPYLGSNYPSYTNKPTTSGLEFRGYGKVNAYDAHAQVTGPRFIKKITSTYTGTGSSSLDYSYMALTQYNIAIPFIFSSTITNHSIPRTWQDDPSTFYKYYWQAGLTNVPTVGVAGTGAFIVQKTSDSTQIETASGFKFTPLIGGDGSGRIYKFGTIPFYSATNGISSSKDAALANYGILACCSVPITVSGYTDAFANIYVGSMGTIQKEIVYNNNSQLSNAIINNGGTIKNVYTQV
jgi:hypothetical protein